MGSASKEGAGNIGRSDWPVDIGGCSGFEVVTAAEFIRLLPGNVT
jgi:hypothetical protein